MSLSPQTLRVQARLAQGTKEGRKHWDLYRWLLDPFVLRALALLLEPIYERVFLPCSYGFRPGRSPIDCVAQTAQRIYRHRHVLEADIEGFFDHVSHRKLLGMLKEQIVDPRILGLTREILKAGFREVGKPWEPTEEGTPQGGPLSPLWANVYLHYALDERFREATKRHGRSELFRFADDFVILSRRKSEINALRRAVNVWMREAHLNLKEEKTRVVDLRNSVRGTASKFDFLGFKIHLRAFKDNPERFWVARQPSEKSRKNLRTNLKSKLVPQLSLDQARTIVKAVWKGS